jgi:outer membrane murein-binding lipoprotein Lpp
MTRSLPLTLLCASLGIAALAGCSNDPELKNQLTPELRNADYPPLLPIEELDPLQPLPNQESAQLEKNLNARSNSLQRRADALRRATN